MAKRKGKVDMVEETLDAEIAAAELETQAVAQTPSSSDTSKAKTKSFKLHFFGRDYVQDHFPKSLRVAERFAKEWVEEGSFDYLPISDERAKAAVLTGIQKIRTVEKRAEEVYQEKLAPIVKLASERVEKLIEQVQQARR